MFDGCTSLKNKPSWYDPDSSRFKKYII
jgi:hypothetical protein